MLCVCVCVCVCVFFLKKLFMLLSRSLCFVQSIQLSGNDVVLRVDAADDDASSDDDDDDDDEAADDLHRAQVFKFKKNKNCFTIL